MKRKLYLFLLFPFVVFAQQKEMQKAEEKFKDEHYIESIKIFENLVDKGIATSSVLERLGDANYFNANYVDANKWYSKRYFLSPEMDSEHHYRYSQTLKSVGLLPESTIQMAIFDSKKPDEIRTYFNKSESIENSKFQFSNVSILPFNSTYSDYGTTFKGDTIVFTSARDFVLDNTTYARTKQSYSSLYQSIKKANGEYSNPKLFSRGSFSVYHEATPVFTRDGKTMYYSQNQLSKQSKSKLVNGLFKIYKSIYTNGKWKNKGPISFGENDSIRVANPALTPDGLYLYFAADFSDSYGKSDLYKVALNADGTYGNVEHLSSTVNTEGRETFPFITEDNTLIFASDGHKGLGGLDLFSLDLSDPKASAIHLGVAINGPFDDFALTINPEMNQGFYTSNRPGGMGDDDLYSFDLSLQPLVLDGQIVDKETNAQLPNAIVTLLNSKNEIIETTQSDVNGSFILHNIKPNLNAVVQITKENYRTSAEHVVFYKRDLHQIFALNKQKNEIQSGVDLDYLLAANVIYFDTDQSIIREDSKQELDKVVSIMKQYPEIQVEIGSHTDSRESKVYNLRLSQARAEATLKYIVSKGVERTRLIPKAYGENQLLNKCDNGIECSAAEHRKNRRSTFKIR